MCCFACSWPLPWRLAPEDWVGTVFVLTPSVATGALDAELMVLDSAVGADVCCLACSFRLPCPMMVL